MSLFKSLVQQNNAYLNCNGATDTTKNSFK